MRLLFLIPETCPTFRVDVSVLFGKHLPRHGIYSDIVAARASGQDSEIVWGGGEAYLCEVSSGPGKKHLKTLLHGFQALFRAKTKRYQAIQVRDMPVLAAVGLLVARLKKLQFFYWMSYPMPEGQIALARERRFSAGLMKFMFPWLRGLAGNFLLYRFVLPMSNHIFVQTDRMRENMVDKGLEFDRMTPVPMGVDMEEICAANIQPTDDPRLKGKRVLVYLGTLDRPRRIELLFELLAILRKVIPDVMMVLVGDTEDKKHRLWLEEQAGNAGVADAVVWTGWMPMREGWRYVKAAEVGLSPIPRGLLLDVGSPTKALEYLALGIPVVGNDNPDQAWVIQESGAGRCVPYTPEDFAPAIIELLKLDPDERANMAERGREFVREHRDYKVIARAVAARYQQLIVN